MTENKKLWTLDGYYFNDQQYPADKIGVWIKAGGKRIRYTADYYPCGFHGYMSKPINIYGHNMICIPVKFRRVHTVGRQDDRKVLVAYEMKIPTNWRKYIR